MSTPREVLEAARGEVFVDEDGAEIRLELEPPAPDEEIARLEGRLPGVLPPDVTELLELTRGFCLGDLEVELLGVLGQYLEGAAAGQLDILADGHGNSWFVEVHSDGTWGSVFFAGHDPPVLLYQSDDLARRGDEE